MLRTLAIDGPTAGFKSQEASRDYECHGEYAEDAMDYLVPAPIVLEVAGRVDLTESDDDPCHPHEHTMNLVYMLIVLRIINELAGACRR